MIIKYWLIISDLKLKKGNFDKELEYNIG